MRNIKKSGFTLIELIVVITILAILGTIAFMAYQGQTGDARNSKRTSDLKQIGDSIRVKLGEGISILSFVKGVPKYNIPSTSNIGGDAVGPDNYLAGTTNFLLLDAKAENFRDPNGADYALAVSTKRYGKYELAATLENQAAPRTAKVTGNYSPRDGDIFSGIPFTKNGDTTGAISDIKYTGNFVLGDNTNFGKVQKVTGGVNLTLEGPIGAGNIKLKSVGTETSEVKGLIYGKNTTDSGIITEGGDFVPYTY